MRKILWIVVFLMAGCSTTVVDREQYLILKSFKNDTPHGEGTGKSIKIARATLPLYLNSREIVYVRDGIARAYAHSFWGDLPSDFYRLVLLDKLERSGLFTAVIEQGGVVDADLILQSRVEEFEQVIGEDGGAYAKISVNLTLLDAKGAKELAHTRLSAQKLLADWEIHSLQAAFENALNDIGSQAVLWLDENLNAK